MCKKILLEVNITLSDPHLSAGGETNCAAAAVGCQLPSHIFESAAEDF